MPNHQPSSKLSPSLLACFRSAGLNSLPEFHDPDEFRRIFLPFFEGEYAWVPLNAFLDPNALKGFNCIDQVWERDYDPDRSLYITTETFKHADDPWSVLREYGELKLHNYRSVMQVKEFDSTNYHGWVPVFSPRTYRFFGQAKSTVNAIDSAIGPGTPLDLITLTSTSVVGSKDNEFLLDWRSWLPSGDGKYSQSGIGILAYTFRNYLAFCNLILQEMGVQARGEDVRQTLTWLISQPVLQEKRFEATLKHLTNASKEANKATGG